MENPRGLSVCSSFSIQLIAMSRSMTHLRMFVASPGDVPEERSAVREVVARVNMQIGDRVGIVIDLVEWPTSILPGIGLESQEVINRQVGKCDIFVIIFWKRLGTPTNNHLSGTVEEFEAAYDAWKSDSKTQVYVYFSRRPFYPTLEELPEVRRLLAFKRQISRRGVLCYVFDSIMEFENKLHDHLSLHLLQLKELTEPGGEGLVLRELPDNRLFRRAFREGLDDARDLGIIYCDLDHFTDLKNALYEKKKDWITAIRRSNELLAHIATTIFGTVGNRGHVFRYAGDEFAVLVLNRHASTVTALAKQIRAAVEKEGDFEGFHITASIGVACTPAVPAGLDMRERAEDATYVAKLTGRNRVVAAPLSQDQEELIREARERGNS